MTHTVATATATLTLICDRCGKPVPDGRGYVCVDKVAAMFDVPERIRQWRQANPGPIISGPALLNYPEQVRWQVFHRRCDPAKDRDSDYWFDVSRCRSYQALLGWTAHLLEKRWFEHTHWNQFIYRVLSMNGDERWADA